MRTCLWSLAFVLSGLCLLRQALCQQDFSRADQEIQAVIHGDRFDHSTWGLYAVDLKSGQVLVDINSNAFMVPASTTKLFSVAAAWNALGPDFRFRTPLVLTAPINDQGASKGDLILIASGDLTMGGRTDSEDKIQFENEDHTYASPRGRAKLTPANPLAGLQSLAHQAREAGLRRIEGRVLIDDRLFDEAMSSGSGPVHVSPIMINDNLVDFLVTPAANHKKAKVSVRPETNSIEIDADVLTSSDVKHPQIMIAQPSPGRYLIRGKIPPNHPPLVLIEEILHPAEFARQALVEALQKEGIIIEPNSQPHSQESLPPKTELQSLKPIAELISPPFSENAKLILKVSHNLHASTLPLLLANKNGNRSLASGMQWERLELETLGIALKAVSFGGGAGGTRSDFVTCQATVQLLKAMYARDDFDRFRNCLARLGVDGTCAKHVPEDSPVRGHVYAKTGSLYWENLLNENMMLTSKALAGYLTTKSNRQVAFSFIVNNLQIDSTEQTTEIGKILGRLCEIGFEHW